MKNFILTPGVLVFVLLVSLFVGAIQLGVSNVIKENITVAKNVSCSPRALREGSTWEADVLLELDCGGKYAYVSDKKILVAYANKQVKHIVCTTFKSGAASCKPSKN